jgi:Cdc6-like AAA superfamily ATPase
MHTHVSTAELSVLNGCRRAQGAGISTWESERLPQGDPGERVGRDRAWTEDFDKSPVFWLNGLAGTGKSTIAQTIAERVFADGRLGASFFCSRGFEDRSNLQLIFPTLAFQLAQKYPAFRSSLVPLLQSNPDVVHESLQDQMQKFLVEPLRSADISTVIVIDALDECRTKTQNLRSSSCWDSRFRHSRSQVLHHQQTGNAHHDWVPRPAAEGINRRLHSPRSRTSQCR